MLPYHQQVWTRSYSGTLPPAGVDTQLQWDLTTSRCGHAATVGPYHQVWTRSYSGTLPPAGVDYYREVTLYLQKYLYIRGKGNLHYSDMSVIQSVLIRGFTIIQLEGCSPVEFSRDYNRACCSGETTSSWAYSYVDAAAAGKPPQTRLAATWPCPLQQGTTSDQACSYVAMPTAAGKPPQTRLVAT